MPVITDDGLTSGPSVVPVAPRIDVATETHRTVSTDTNFDMVPWIEPDKDGVNDSCLDGGHVVGEEAPGSGMVASLDDDEYDSSDEKDSITPEILASGGTDPCSHQAEETGSSSLSLADSPSSIASGGDAVSEVGNSPVNGIEQENAVNPGRPDDKETDIVKIMEREIARLTNKINDLEDENQDMKIHCAELHRSTSVACYLEYTQRMELMHISNKLTDLEEENEYLKEEIWKLEKRIVEIELSAMFDQGNQGDDGDDGVPAKTQ